MLTTCHPEPRGVGPSNTRVVESTRGAGSRAKDLVTPNFVQVWNPK